MRRTLLRYLLPAAGLAALAALAAASRVEVAAGEVLLVRSGATVEIYEAGTHWRLPWLDRGSRAPRTPIPWNGRAAVRTPEGASLTVTTSGAFGVRPGGEPAWLDAAAGLPFFDAVLAVVTRAGDGALRDIGGEDLLAEPARKRLEQTVAEALAAAGVDAENLRVELPLEDNPVLLASLRGSFTALARPAGKKVLLIGWDGADWLMIRPLLAAGKLPNLARMIARGTSGELRSEEPLLSPLVWTTIATGKPVVEHGIADFLVKDPATGSLVPISAASRKVHALWTILPTFGLRSDVVAWWATWPAEPTRGTLVSDRVAYQLFDYDASRDGAEGAGKVHPAEAWPAIQGKLVSAEEIPFSTVRRFVDVPEAELARRWEALPADRRQEDRVNHLRKILATTTSYHAIARDLLATQGDLTLVYYEATDTVAHLFARFLPPQLPGVSAEDVARYGGALPELYVYADELLGELLAAVDDDTVVLLVSDHGFFTGETRPESDPADFVGGAPAWHRLFGILVAAGGGVPVGRIDGATIFDLVPTILTLLGLPVAEDMPGRVLRELIPGDVPSPGTVATFETLPRPRAAGASRDAAMDEERLRELVALGYVSASALEAPATAAGGPATGPAASPSPSDVTSSPPAANLETLATEAYNLGRIAQRDGDYDTAARQFRLALERLPSFGEAWASLAQIMSVQGRHSEAFDVLVEGFAASPSLPAASITGLVDEAKQCNRLADAERALESIAPRFGRRPAFFAARALLREEQGRRGEALDAYRQTLEIDPLDQLALDRAIAILREDGKEPEALEILDRAAAAARGQVTHLNYLGVVCLRQGWGDRAEPIFRAILASDPGNPGVLANLAAALAQQRNLEGAITTMRQAVQRDPGNGRNQFNLGAMLADAGRPAEALAAFRAAERAGLKTPRVYVAIAKLAFRTGDRAGARQALERSLAVDPSDAESRELLAILGSGGG